VVLGWIATAAYYLTAPPVYESTADVLLMPKDPGLAARGLENGRDVNSTLSDDLLATHMMLIQSPAIVDEALKKEKLQNLPSLVEGMTQEDKSTTDYVIRKMLVSRGGQGKAKNAQVLRVAFRHNNAADSKKVVLAVVDQFRNFIGEKYADVNQTAADLIEKAQSQLKNDLELAETEFREFRENAPLLRNGDSSTNIFRTEHEQIEATLTDLRMQRSELDSRLKLVEQQLASIGDSKGNDIQKLALVDEKSAERIRIFLEIYGGKAESQLFQSQQPERLEAARGEYEGLLQLKARMQALITDFGSEHAEVRTLRNQIETIENFLKTRSSKLQVTTNEEVLTPAKLVDAYVSLLRHDLKALNDREALLVESSKRAEREAKSLVQFELKGEGLRLAVDRQKDLFEATVDRLREINLAKDFGGFVNELIKKPMEGEEIWPKLPICAALGTLAGLLLGGLAAAVLELRNRSVRSVRDVELITGAHTISLVPRLMIHTEPRSRRMWKASGSRLSPIVATHHFPHSRESEVFRGLRTTLMFKANAAQAKVIAITSSSSGDGKSTVVANLAMSLAQAGRRVLLVGADMRRPTVAKTFGIESQVGLADLLQGTATLFEAIVTSENPKLDVLVAGKLPANPAELLASRVFKSLIEDAKTDYDLVLIDCPPVLAVADPCVIASCVDGVVVVIRVNPQSRVELRRTMELLAEVHSKVLGTVVNASKLQTVEGGRSDDYGGAYGYGAYGARSAAYFREESASPRSSQASESSDSKGATAAKGNGDRTPNS
jgi:capsular exopolysaccharide synthesis family protein